MGVLVVFPMSAGTMAGQKWVELQKKIGQETRVCGTVVGYAIGAHIPSSDCSSAKLKIGHPGDPQLDVTLPNGSGAFPFGAADQYGTHDICVAGTLEVDDKDAMYIAVTHPEQMQMTDDRPVVPFGSGAPFPCEAGRTQPEPIREVPPNYTRKLMNQRAQDTVVRDVLINIDGRVPDARVLRGRYPEMNGQALDAVGNGSSGRHGSTAVPSRPSRLSP